MEVGGELARPVEDGAIRAEQAALRQIHAEVENVERQAGRPAPQRVHQHARHQEVIAFAAGHQNEVRLARLLPARGANGCGHERRNPPSRLLVCRCAASAVRSEDACLLTRTQEPLSPDATTL